MDAPRDYHSKSEKRQLYGITYIWNLILRKDRNELIYKIETHLQILETNLQLPEGKCGAGIN